MVFIERPVPGITKTKPAHKNGNGNRPDLKTAFQEEIRPAVALSETIEIADGSALSVGDTAFSEGKSLDISNLPTIIWKRSDKSQDPFVADGSFGEAESSIAENGETESPSSISSEIVNRAKEGDGEALTEIYQQLFPRIYRYALVRTGSTELAEDLTQDVFEKSLFSLDNYEDRGIPFDSWIFRIAHNHLVSYRRRTHRTAQIKEDMRDDFNMEDVDRKLDVTGSFKRVAEVLPQLSELQRQIILSRFIQGLSVSEIASALGKSDDSIKVNQSKALGNLRVLLGVPPRVGYPGSRYL